MSKGKKEKKDPEQKENPTGREASIKEREMVPERGIESNIWADLPRRYPELKYLVYYVGASIILSLVLLAAKGISILRTLQAALGLAYVLFIPGYLATKTLFSDKEIDIIETLALSFALSIALVTLTIIFTNNVLRVPVNAINNFIIILVLMIAIIMVKIIRNAIEKARKE